MKRYLMLFSIFCFLVSPVLGDDKQPEMMKGAKLTDVKPESMLIVGVNDLTESMAEPGWPIIVSVSMLSDDGSTTMAVPNNLQPKLLSGKDKVSVKFDAVDSQNTENKFWIISESETQNLEPKNYTVTLEPVEGTVIQPAELNVVAKVEDSEALGKLKIQKYLLLGKDDEALNEANQQTTADAENINAWVAKGDILMDKDLPDEAIKAYEKALELSEKAGDSEPLFIQERHRAAFFRSLEKRGVIKTEDDQP